MRVDESQFPGGTKRPAFRSGSSEANAAWRIVPGGLDRWPTAAAIPMHFRASDVASGAT